MGRKSEQTIQWSRTSGQTIQWSRKSGQTIQWSRKSGQKIRWSRKSGQTIQWPKEQKDKQLSTKHYTENQRPSNTSQTKKPGVNLVDPTG